MYEEKAIPSNAFLLLLALHFFVNILLFASCTDTFIKWCKITRGMKRSAQ
jgi:hypothetical protein